MNFKSYPFLPLRDTVVFPKQETLLYFGRKKSISAIEFAIEEDTPVVLATQLDPKIDNPTINDIYEIGVVAKIKKVFNLTDGSLKVSFNPLKKVKIIKLDEKNF